MGLFYTIVKFSGRIGLPMYFGKLEINGLENVPKNQPYILAPNHQSAFLDAVVTGVFNPSPVHYLTRSDVFVKPFDKILRALNMMPVYRLRDGYEKLKKNEEVFAKCDDLLSKNLPVLIFPEGNMGDGHFLRPLTKGTSRMAIQAQKNIQQDIYILPVGLNYFHHDRPRYKCIINYGKPIRVRDYLKVYEEHNAKGLITLRNDLSAHIKELLLIPEKADYEDQVKSLNRFTEKLTFETLKGHINEQKSSLPKYYPKWKWLPSLLTVFNPITIWGVQYILKNVIKERQFIGSLKYILGLFISVIWWTSLFVLLYIFVNLKVACSITLLSIIMLIVRSDLKKYTHPLFE